MTRVIVWGTSAAREGERERERESEEGCGRDVKKCRGGAEEAQGSRELLAGSTTRES
jgi:hypothetical protein